MVAYINTGFINEADATLHVGDLSIQRGYALFDFFRTKNKVPLFLDDYIDRFFNSASLMGLQPLHNRQQLKANIYEMIERNNSTEAGFKIILTGGYSADMYEPATPNFILLQLPIQLPTKEKFEQGLKIMLYEYLRDLPEVKSTNYLMGVWLQNKLRHQQADEVLYHKDGNILEFPRSNVFIVTKDHVVVTPKANMLLGITRKKVLELAAKKYKTEERAVTLDDLANASEVFLTSTTRRILPVLKVDDRIIGEGTAGEVTCWLQEEFLKMEDEYISP